MLAPSGWNCQAIVGGDGSTPLDVWPPGAPTSVENGVQGQGIEGYVIPGANIEGQYEKTCALFPASVTLAISGAQDGGQPYACGPTPPKTETDSTFSDRVIAFTDPPGVSGTWDNSGNANPAEGIVIFNPGGASNTPNTEMAVCILPASKRAVCTAALADFGAHYGGLAAGSSHGSPTSLPTPPISLTGQILSVNSSARSRLA